MRGNDSLSYDPKDNEAVLVPFSQVVGVEIENGDKTAYGDLLDEYCYITISKESGNYQYYVTLADDTYHTMVGVNYSNISDKMINVSDDNVSGVQPLSVPLASYKVKINGDDYSIKRMRVKLYTTYVQSGVTKNATLTGYYANDGSENSGGSANVKGTIANYDTLINNTKKVTYNGVQHTITGSDILYVVVKK